MKHNYQLVLLVGLVGSFGWASPITQKSPPRTIKVDSFAIKCSSVSSGSPMGISLSAGLGNASGSSSVKLPAPIQLSEPAAFASGLAEVLKSALADEKGWIVIDPPVQDSPAVGSAETPSDPVVRPQYLIRATAIEMNVSTKSSGLNIGGLGGSQGDIKNKVVIDIKLVDAVSMVVLETVTATGTKSTKTNFLGVFGSQDQKLFGWEEFKECPLATAADLAIKDGVKKLGEKVKKYPWEAEIADIRQENDSDAIYLNVGPQCGLKLGQILELFIPGDLIIDKKSGLVSGRSRPKIMGKVRVSDIESELVVVQPVDDVKVEIGMHVRLPKV